jgi:hypothetical protein
MRRARRQRRVPSTNVKADRAQDLVPCRLRHHVRRRKANGRSREHAACAPFAVANIAPPAPEGVRGVSAITLQGVAGFATTFVTRQRNDLHFAGNAIRVRLGRDCLSRSPCLFRFPQSLMRSNFSSLLLNAVRADSWFVFRIGSRTIARRPLQVGTRSRPRGSRLSNDAHGE